MIISECQNCGYRIHHEEGVNVDCPECLKIDSCEVVS